MTTYRIRVIHDESPESPREWDNVGTMACWHRRYDLGDEQPKQDPIAYKYAMGVGFLPNGAPDFDDADDDQVEVALEAFEAHYIHLPLYLYDHSGITMRTSAFSCPWDSGRVGFIFAEKGTEGMSDETITKALQAEVATYAQYLEGDMYGFQLERAVPYTKTYADGRTEVDADWELEDSCYGFYGSDPHENGMGDHLPRAAREVLPECFDDVGAWKTFTD